MRVRHPVRADKTVVMEVVVRCVIAVEVPAVAVDLHSVGILPVKGLVHEIPDEPALVGRVLADEVPVFPEAAQRITHRMGVLALDKWLARIAFAVFYRFVIAVVHRAEDVRIVVCPCLFVLYRP